MSITAILAIIIALGSAIVGAFAGHARGKSVGKDEGVQATEVKQAETQHSAQYTAIVERLDADQKAAAAPDADLDSKLSEFDRKS